MIAEQFDIFNHDMKTALIKKEEWMTTYFVTNQSAHRGCLVRGLD